MRGPLGAVIGRYPSSDGNTQMGGIIRHNRKCRDIAFLVIFIAFWVAMIVNSSFGFNQGNPLRLTYGLDYKGNVCGEKHAKRDLRELELRYWLDPNQVYQSGLKSNQFKLANARSICLLDCPIPLDDQLNWVCDYPEGDIHLSMGDWINMNYDYYEFLTPEMRNTSLQLQGPCYPVIFPSVNVYWSCQFIARASNMSLRHWQQMGGVKINEDIIIDKSIHRSINSRSSVLKRYMADIGKAWPVLIVCGGILPLFLSVIWLLMIRHFVVAMPWITVALFNVLMVSVTMFYYLKAGWIGNDAISPIIGEHDPYIHVFGREINHLRAAAVLMTFIMVVAVLTSIVIVRRIIMATSVLKVAAKVIGEVQALIIFPIIPYTILAIFYMFWFSAALHLFSSGQVVQNNCNTNCCAYDLVSKRVNCDHCCGYSINYTPHIGVAILFHLFGCYWATQFLIACSSTVIAGSVASYYWAGGATSVAITGKSFCKASAIATELILNNILRIGRVNVIGDVILFLGKLCVSLSSALFAFLMLDAHKYRSGHNKITSPLFPVLVCWCLGYIVATLFFGVVEMSIDTIILSFCQDSEEHQGTAQYAPPLLMETLNDQNEMQRLTQGPH
ncbi:choline transporter protein 1 isoform X3 [Carya illinoinensis]|uniref:choline transporter protein 1 isoform X3 n=1 Tax=Carya illinoinensis TaxID=32201 RepID=UPI001C71FF6D|nr:choline transporter protein 1 isoform X3 [Carya illinoinensis]